MRKVTAIVAGLGMLALCTPVFASTPDDLNLKLRWFQKPIASILSSFSFLPYADTLRYVYGNRSLSDVNRIRITGDLTGHRVGGGDAQATGDLTGHRVGGGDAQATGDLTGHRVGGGD